MGSVRQNAINWRESADLRDRPLDGTDPHHEFVEAVACPNAVLSIAVSPALKLAAAVWINCRLGSLANARLDCIRYVAEKLAAIEADWRFWLVATHRSLQPDTKITRHLGLWKSFKKRGLHLPIGDYLEETLTNLEGGGALLWRLALRARSTRPCARVDDG
jgi:hypothetical protein